MESNNLILNRLFTKYIFRDLLMNHTNQIYGTIIQRYLQDEFSSKNGEIISKIYKYMSKNYRNEYFYQNTLLNKLLLGRHSINTTTALTQVPIGKSKADFVMINGKAVVYEIKTELDSFERLETQIADYYKSFNYVCVVTSEDNYNKIRLLLQETNVGIYILTKKNTLQVKKEPQEDNTHLSYKAIFKVLRKKEFEDIILSYYDKLPESTPVFFYDECFKWFSQIPLEQVYLMFLKILKKRNTIVKEWFLKVPYELKSLMYFYDPTEKDYQNLSDFLNNRYGR